MSARREFDIDAIVQDVRVAANLRPPATTATLLQNRPNRSNVANVATITSQKLRNALASPPIASPPSILARGRS
jgi:hypothetical protein